MENITIQITSISLEHTNPSLGPFEKPIEISLTNSEQHKLRINQFLIESNVNGAVSLQEYLHFWIANDKDKLAKVHNKAPQIDKKVGQTISNLVFYLQDGTSVKMSDVYRDYNLSKFNPDFTKYMVENGSRSGSEDVLK